MIFFFSLRKATGNDFFFSLYGRPLEMIFFFFFFLNIARFSIVFCYCCRWCSCSFSFSFTCSRPRPSPLPMKNKWNRILITLKEIKAKHKKNLNNVDDDDNRK